SGKNATAVNALGEPRKLALSAWVASPAARSYTLTIPSARAAAASGVLPGTATEATPAGSAGIVSTGLPSAAGQTRIRLPLEPETTLIPSRVTATALTASVWPLRVWSTLPLLRSKALIDLSAEAV